jgi:hypothetical protein
MSETKWNKKITFAQKKKDIAEIKEGFDETKEEFDEIEQKIKRIRNKKKGFTRLPFLESIYGPVIEGAEVIDVLSEAANAASAEVDAKTAAASAELAAGVAAAKKMKAETEDAIAKAADAIDAPSSGTTIPTEITEEEIKKKTQTAKTKFLDFIYYCAKLPYNVSNDVFASTICLIALGKSPQEINEKADQEQVARMANRIFTSLIGIFITYNLYFLYSTPNPPPTPGALSIFEIIDALPTVAFPLKCALTPVKIFLKIISYMHDIMALVPYKSLLFMICLWLSFTFMRNGGPEYFTTMFISGLNVLLDPKGKYSKTRGGGEFAKKHGDDLPLIIVILLCTIGSIAKFCYEMKTVEFIKPYGLLAWFVVFGISLLLLFFGKIVIASIVFIICMFSMMKSKDNGIDILQTMKDIDVILIGSTKLYDCDGDISPIKKILNFLNNDLSSTVVKNLYLLTLIPIFMFNIYRSNKINSKPIQGLSNFISVVLIIVLSSGNEKINEIYNGILRSLFKND